MTSYAKNLARQVLDRDKRINQTWRELETELEVRVSEFNSELAEGSLLSISLSREVESNAFMLSSGERHVSFVLDESKAIIRVTASWIPYIMFPFTITSSSPTLPAGYGSYERELTDPDYNLDVALAYQHYDEALPGFEPEQEVTISEIVEQLLRQVVTRN